MAVLVSKGITVPASGKLLGDFAVGESVFLNVNGVRKEFIVAHQGNPKTSLYDSSCNGTWLVMKDVYANIQWHSADNVQYSNANINSYLNNTFVPLLDTEVQSAIKQVKIPWAYYSGSVNSGANGLSTKAFALSLLELNQSSYASDWNYPTDGAPLELFVNSPSYIASNSSWWTRSRTKNGNSDACLVNGSSSFGSYSVTYSYGVRPTMILPQNAMFHEKTLQFMGVK